MSRNRCLDAALRELANYGIRDVAQSHGGKHLQLRWQVNGHTPRMYSCPITPSDVRSAANTRADIRRMLREDGIIIVIKQPKISAPPAPKLQHRVATLEGQVAALRQELAALKLTLEN